VSNGIYFSKKMWECIVSVKKMGTVSPTTMHTPLYTWWAKSHTPFNYVKKMSYTTKYQLFIYYLYTTFFVKTLSPGALGHIGVN